MYPTISSEKLWRFTKGKRKPKTLPSFNVWVGLLYMLVVNEDARPRLDWKLKRNRTSEDRQLKVRSSFSRNNGIDRWCLGSRQDSGLSNRVLDNLLLLDCGMHSIINPISLLGSFVFCCYFPILISIHSPLSSFLYLYHLFRTYLYHLFCIFFGWFTLIIFCFPLLILHPQVSVSFFLLSIPPNTLQIIFLFFLHHDEQYPSKPECKKDKLISSPSV